MSIAKTFQRQSRLVQVLLLLVPVVNWITEIVVRWSAWATNHKGITLLSAILVTFLGLFWGWIDIVWVLLFKHLTFARA